MGISVWGVFLCFCFGIFFSILRGCETKAGQCRAKNSGTQLFRLDSKKEKYMDIEMLFLRSLARFLK